MAHDEHSARTILKLDQITSGYGSSTIVNGVTIDIKKGESVSLVGRNGVGKTTLVKAVIGINHISAGTIEFQSQRIENRAPSEIARLGIGYVPQGRGIFSRLSVSENLTMGALVGVGTEQLNYEEVFDWFPSLKERRFQPAGTLSGGEQQMLSIGRVLVGNPSLLLLDEPSEGIQPSIVELIADVIWRQMEEKGVTVLLVEQNFDMVNMLSERCVVMDKGAVVANLSPEDFLNPDVAQRYRAV
jgi:branched-chain amino acid transport system ATP-binding protein